MTKKVQIRASAKQPVVATEFRFNGESNRAVGANGELNASSKRDLFNRSMAFITAASAGQVISASQMQEREQIEREHRELLAAAFNDDRAHRVLGEKIADSLYMTANRQGFARKFLTKNTLEQGSIPRFPVRMKDVTAVWSTSPTKIDSKITRDKWLTPPELQIVARPFVPQTEIDQSSGDVLEEKFVEATEAIMVSEDRLLYNLVNEVVGIDNNQSIIAGQLTPYTLAQVMTNVERWGLKTPYVLMASDLRQDIIGNSEFYTAMDPIARHELLLTGEIGVLYGSTVVSDAYRHPAHKVLNQGEFFVFADALNLGAYSDRGGIQSEPTSIGIEKVPGRGWVLYESFALAIANSRAVAKGIRA